MSTKPRGHLIVPFKLIDECNECGLTASKEMATLPNLPLPDIGRPFLTSTLPRRTSFNEKDDAELVNDLQAVQ
jgi:hypothetical protein